MRKYAIIIREGEQEVRRHALFVGCYTFVPGAAGDLQSGQLVELHTNDAPGIPERSLE